MTEHRIPLSDDLQFRWFATAMNILNPQKLLLSEYDLAFYRKLRDGYNCSKREMTLTVKQMNHLRQVAAEIKEGTYGK